MGLASVGMTEFASSRQDRAGQHWGTTGFGSSGDDRVAMVMGLAAAALCLKRQGVVVSQP